MAKLKSFRVGIPAHVTVFIQARDRASAHKKAKQMESFSIVPGGKKIEPFIGGCPILEIELGKRDPDNLMEELPS